MCIRDRVSNISLYRKNGNDVIFPNDFRVLLKEMLYKTKNILYYVLISICSRLINRHLLTLMSFWRANNTAKIIIDVYFNPYKYLTREKRFPLKYLYYLTASNH